MSNDTFRQKIIRFLVPGRLATGFLLGVAFMIWLVLYRKPMFDEMILFVTDFFALLHG